MRRLHQPLLGSVKAMAMFRRRRQLDLRPVAESHDEFVQRHPDADRLLADADGYLAEREADYNREIAPRAVEGSELID